MNVKSGPLYRQMDIWWGLVCAQRAVIRQEILAGCRVSSAGLGGLGDLPVPCATVISDLRPFVGEVSHRVRCLLSQSQTMAIGRLVTRENMATLCPPLAQNPPAQIAFTQQIILVCASF